MLKNRKRNLLQWHPAFFAGIQIELEAEADELIFEREHNLSTKPMQIDVLIIKKNTAKQLKKNIGRIFRKYNIIEYKSPDDYLSIDDFYKVYGYACFYKADTGKTNEIKASELTISFVCSHYPRALILHLKNKRKIQITAQEDGIYYITGDYFPIQLIITSKLSESTNLWLKNLTNDIKTNQSVEKIINAYSKHNENKLYKSIMDIIIRANQEAFKEAKVMCEALRELMKDEIEQGIAQGMAQGMAQGITRGIEQGEEKKLRELICKKFQKGKCIEQIADELEETIEAIMPLYNQVVDAL